MSQVTEKLQRMDRGTRSEEEERERRGGAGLRRASRLDVNDPLIAGPTAHTQTLLLLIRSKPRARGA
ncbi:unnamed protein product [Arctogadus glacialis]